VRRKCKPCVWPYPGRRPPRAGARPSGPAGSAACQAASSGRPPPRCAPWSAPARPARSSPQSASKPAALQGGARVEQPATHEHGSMPCKPICSPKPPSCALQRCQRAVDNNAEMRRRQPEAPRMQAALRAAQAAGPAARALFFTGTSSACSLKCTSCGLTRSPGARTRMRSVAMASSSRAYSRKRCAGRPAAAVSALAAHAELVRLQSCPQARTPWHKHNVDYDAAKAGAGRKEPCAAPDQLCKAAREESGPLGTPRRTCASASERPRTNSRRSASSRSSAGLAAARTASRRAAAAAARRELQLYAGSSAALALVRAAGRAAPTSSTEAISALAAHVGKQP